MTDHSQPVDVAIVGGGLAGGLIALALMRERPDLRLAVIEAGDTLGGHHRWSWFASDVDADGAALLGAIPHTRWDDGYGVTFPDHSRSLGTGYRSMASADFHAAIAAVLPDKALHLGRKAVALDAQSVTLDGDERIAARIVVDCRSFVKSEHLTGGWQVFHGKRLRLPAPHGLTRPVIMDANVDQLAPHGNGGAYRFVYVLPLSETDVFIEDTYYADDPQIDRDLLSSRIDAYARSHGWGDGIEVDAETGVLPVITGGDFRAYRCDIESPGVVAAGARAGFTHPLTSYTLPFAAKTALLLARHIDLPPPRLAEKMQSRARSHWRRTGFYRLLSRMLFHAADPKRRVDVFQRFYRLDEALIERFYAGRSTWADRARVLSGKPPVAVPRAIRSIFQRGTPQKQPSQPETPA